MADNTSYLVDSSVWIDARRAGPESDLYLDLKDWIRTDRIVTNSFIRLELLTGAPTETEYAQLTAMLDPIRELALDDPTWLRATRLGFDLRRLGVTVPHSDLLIAANALEHDCTVYHRDRHFEMIARHSRLKAKGI